MRCSPPIQSRTRVRRESASHSYSIFSPVGPGHGDETASLVVFVEDSVFAALFGFEETSVVPGKAAGML